MKVKKVALFFVYNIIVAFWILFLIELGFIYLFNHPKRLPQKYFGQIQDINKIKAIELEYDFKGNIDSSGLMILSIKQDTTSLFWQGIKTMKSYYSETKDGSIKVENRFTIDQPLEFKIDEPIDLAVYYWNIKKSNFSLDNLHLKMREAQIKAYSF